MVKISQQENGGYSNTPVLRTDKELGQTAQLRILFDWVGFTFKSELISIYDVMEWFENYLGIDREAFQAGRKNYEGYASSFVFENINIYYEGASNQGIHVDITGQGCRFLDFYFQKLRVQDYKMLTSSYNTKIHSWYDLLELLHLSEDIKFTRLDIACDDLYGYIDIYHVFKKCLAGEFTSKFRSWTPYGKFDTDGNSNGLTLYFGSDDSDLQCTFYEKNKQLKLDYHWTRIELRFKQKRASELVNMILMSDNNQEIGIYVAGVLKNYLTFRVKNEKDSNKRRWKVAPWWDNFLRGIPKLQIASALPDRSIIRSRKWIDNQVSRSFARLYFAYQDINESWLKEVLEDGINKLNQEDLNQIEEFRRLYGKNAQKLLKEDFPINMEQNKKDSEQFETPQKDKTC